MKNIFLFLFLFVTLHTVLAQVEEVKDSIVKEVDTKYREDQFYFAITYNLLGNKPDGISQSGFSSGFHLGFIRDFPVNKRRNVALGVGLGLSSNSFNHNFLIAKDAMGELEYSILDKNDISYTKNKFTTYMVEIPLQLRWRTSTADEHKFWRIYTGVNIGYVLYNSSKFRGDLGTIKNSKIDSFNDFQYGLTMSAGYNTWNIYVYYGLNPIFSGASLNNESVDMNALKIGLIFYIL
ncbi:porin family protein [Bizionia myxarmorum]|uniref:PorT family protein n=1 Tax=Bizionia myxarmorum TaxID=291186 RepID=A0A5D0RC22_9FLAO|nr:porin family protein [Bizionia myxarmorum]TYB78456.1 PorT family protein [Bizionia myxarmorum]